MIHIIFYLYILISSKHKLLIDHNKIYGQDIHIELIMILKFIVYIIILSNLFHVNNKRFNL